MSDVDVFGYLQEKGTHPRRAPGGELHLPCIFCDEPEGKRGRLYINADLNADIPGLYMCHLCGEKGNIHTLRKHFGDPPLPRGNEDEVDSQARYEIFQAAAEYYHEALGDHPEILKYLKEDRGLSVETIIKHKIGYAGGGLVGLLMGTKFSLKDCKATGLIVEDRYTGGPVDFLRAQITLPYHCAGNVVMIRGKEIGGKYLTPPGQKARLFNSDATWGADQIIVAEGEFDALVLEQIGYAAVGVPGANSWQDPWTGYFEGARRVHIVFDNDPTGNAGAEKVARLIGPKARIVNMPEHGIGERKNDPSEWIAVKGHTASDFELLLIKAKGGHLLSVDDAFAEWLTVQTMQGLKFGYETLDNAIKPGLLPSQVMIVLAKTGVGKTLFLLNTFHQILVAQPDVRILFISLEQTRGEWFERARRIYRFYNPTHTDNDCLNFFRDRLLMVDKNQITEKELVNCIEQYEFEMGVKPDLVAIDYLGYWARAYKGEPYERTSAAVMSLKAVAKEYRVAILAPHQVSRIAKFGEEPDADHGRDSGVVEETADFLLVLWSPDSQQTDVDKRTGEVFIRVGKSRHGGKGTKVELKFAPVSLAMVPRQDKVNFKRADDERDWAHWDADFEHAIERHLTGNRNLILKGKLP